MDNIIVENHSLLSCHSIYDKVHNLKNEALFSFSLVLLIICMQIHWLPLCINICTNNTLSDIHVELNTTGGLNHQTNTRI